MSFAAMKTVRLGLLIPVLLSATARAAMPDPANLPPAASFKVDYARDIKPILNRSCLKCHATDRPKGDFSIVSREALLKGGAEGRAVVPGDSAKSALVYYAAHLVEDMEMPPPGKGQRLSAEEVGLLRTWIDQGMAWDDPADALAYAPKLTLNTSFQTLFVRGQQNLFREHRWMREGLAGGVQHLEYRQRLTNGVLVEFDGRAVFGTEDYQARLSLTQPKLGFIRAGAEQYRKYFDDAGGYYDEFGGAGFGLDRELKLDVGRAWIDVGLTLPRLPRMTLGYEYQYRQGGKSLTQWGDVTDAFDTVRNLYPAWKRMDDETHIIKFNLAHDWRGLRIEDNLRIEFSHLDSERYHSSYVMGKDGPDKIAQIAERLRQFQAVNTLQFEKQFKPWLFGAAGYLYQTVDGRAGHGQGVTYLPPSLVAPPPGVFPDDKFWSFNNLVLKQESHVANANLQLAPWRHLTLAAGIQPEWQRQEGVGSVILDEGAPPFAQSAWISANHDRMSLSEDAGLRFAAIPYTVVFADARFRQESLERTEFIGDGNFYEFDRRTDASSNQREYRVGLSFSPISRASLTGHYRRRERFNHYRHPQDIAFMSFGGFPNDGYSAFITGRDEVTDELEAKLTWRPHQIIKGSVGYKYRTTDYRTTTDEAPFGASPGGTVPAAIFRGHTVTATLTFTPHPRFYTSSSLALTDSKTAAYANDFDAIAPWKGVTWTLMNNATYILSKNADLHAGYYVTRSDYRQPQGSLGLPYGSEFISHVAQLGLTRRFGERTIAGLTYAFYDFDETWGGNANRAYTAHGLFATLSVRLR